MIACWRCYVRALLDVAGGLARWTLTRFSTVNVSRMT
jgi:hypothetical protein